MKNLKTIYFVYDADGGVLNEITYWIDKNILNKKNTCELCDISHGKFFAKSEWLKFIKELRTQHKVKVLHRNELPKKIEEKNYQLPSVIIETEEKMIEIFNKFSFQDSNTSLSIIELRKQLYEFIEKL
ncbi:MAG: hypothetical protein CM15mP123_08490 [Gammaproteobacteria bacterium]|nr:MAG: hypothetical protein CM15mP123_08490 [Gammaproteobacteria bacterium]